MKCHHVIRAFHVVLYAIHTGITDQGESKLLCTFSISLFHFIFLFRSVTVLHILHDLMNFGLETTTTITVVGGNKETYNTPTKSNKTGIYEYEYEKLRMAIKTYLSSAKASQSKMLASELKK